MLPRSTERFMERSELSSCSRIVARARSLIAMTVCRGRPHFNDDSISRNEMGRSEYDFVRGDYRSRSHTSLFALVLKTCRLGRSLALSQCAAALEES